MRTKKNAVTAVEEACAVEEQAPQGTASETEAAEEAVAAVVEPMPESLMAELGVEEHQQPAESEEQRFRAMVEASVYIAEEPLTALQIAQALNQPRERVETALAQLVEEYAGAQHGIAIREVAGGFKMSTKPEYHEDIRAFVKKLRPPLKLSLAALETLAVIAYKQPITSPEILEIRGVQGAGVLKTLLERKLITAAGRKQVVGRPVLYKTTKEFLVQFGLKDLAELPTLKEFEEWSRLALGDQEEAAAAPAESVSTVAAAAAEPAAEPATSAEPAPDETLVAPTE